MRLGSIVLTLVLAQAGVASAQGRPAAVGIKAGANFAELKFEADGETADVDSRTGFVGGLFAVWPADGRFALQTEALFSQKGAKASEGEESGRIKLNYLEFPVLVRASTPVSGGTSFHVFGGPSFGFRLSAKTESSFEDDVASEDIDDDVKKFDLGLVAGAGLEFGRLVVDGRYTWGLSDLDKDTADGVKVKNRVFSVMAGIRF